ncbi:helix-turn-helix domain-containing protein [Ruania halotolerans]|uniref:helix-turn-helix domain-containing protein n=1 Tax=Ruania halotolerans TaxID=2897773 RepID=UPI001E2D3A9E|nr:helix-turn-helix transcriptional regulator [Ruania halotolerans]UFU04993.1 helix-turn-helix transcriptional regulator [Ruania halotolerans]
MGDLLQFPGNRRTARASHVRTDQPLTQGHPNPGHGLTPEGSPATAGRPATSDRPATAGDPATASRPTSRATDTSPRPLLWREAVGHELRCERHRQERHLTDVAHSAGISPQYLSEVERGRKEASSEILAAAAESLGLELATLTTRASHTLGSATPQLRAA